MTRYRKKIYQYDVDGSFIREFESISDASRTLGLNTGSLSRSVKYGWKHGGYNWSDKCSESYTPPPKDETSKNVAVGNVYASDEYGEYEVLRFSHRDASKRKHYYIRFKNTGFEEEFDTASIKRGNVTDYMCPTVYGVGYLGSRNYIDKQIQVAWRMMLRRCYSDFESAHLYEDVTVVDRWHNLQNFAKDIVFVDRYDEDRFQAGELVLDKDLKQQDKSRKIYSLDTCTFLTTSENLSIANREVRPEKGVV